MCWKKLEACSLIIYDFSKPFDCINHSFLLEKLKSLCFFLYFSSAEFVLISGIDNSVLKLDFAYDKWSSARIVAGHFLSVMLSWYQTVEWSCVSLHLCWWYLGNLSYFQVTVNSLENVIAEFNNIYPWSVSNCLRLNSEERKLCDFVKGILLFFSFSL